MHGVRRGFAFIMTGTSGFVPGITYLTVSLSKAGFVLWCSVVLPSNDYCYMAVVRVLTHSLILYFIKMKWHSCHFDLPEFITYQ